MRSVLLWLLLLPLSANAAISFVSSLNFGGANNGTVYVHKVAY